MIGGELRGLRALVSGASKGIGSAIAKRLRDEGATVLGTARTVPPGLPTDVQFVAADRCSRWGAATTSNSASSRLSGVSRSDR